MKLLVIGSGGREHALCWRLKQDRRVTRVFCAPGNAGISQEAICVPMTTPDAIAGFCKQENIDLVVVGPEQPLVDGLADQLRAKNILVFGPSARAARLEGSKGFMKDICKKYNIPTAKYARFNDEDSALAYLEEHPAPIVIKADGLAAGKGVTVAMTDDEAQTAIAECFAGRFGKSGASIVIEEYMEGEEVSFFAFSDGKTALSFAAAQDHKRVGDGDTGPNTGGMGSYSPAPIFTAAMEKQVMETIVIPTVEGMIKEKSAYQGILFAGLMITKTGPKLIEYNVRFGDPETQSLIMRADKGLLDAMLACAKGDGLSQVQFTFSNKHALCVVMAAKGYPGDYVKGSEIKRLTIAPGLQDSVKIFHAGTAKQDDKIIATGGRVLGVTALGSTIAEAQKKAYTAVDGIEWKEGFCRRDIGKSAIGKA